MGLDELEIIRVIVNGKAASDPALRQAVETLRIQGRQIEVRVTWEAGDAARFAREAEQAGIDRVVAAGGDGTINEVVAGLLEAGDSPTTKMAILPYGTANDFATGCGVPIGDPLAALQLAVTEPARLVDVGIVNGRPFINVATAGFGAEVTAQTPVEMKRALGGAAYSLMGLVQALKMTAWQTRVIVDDEVSEGAMIVLAIGNGRQAGGGYQLTQHAVLDDGLLDLMVVHDVEFPRFGELLNELQEPQNPQNTFVHYRQVKELTVETDDPIQMNLDGEPMRDRRFEFSLLPQRIPLIIPHTDLGLLQSHS